MDSLTPFFRIGDLEAALKSFEVECGALAREIIRPKTDSQRRADALIERAALQTRIVEITKHLVRLRTGGLSEV